MRVNENYFCNAGCGLITSYTVHTQTDTQLSFQTLHVIILISIMLHVCMYMFTYVFATFYVEDNKKYIDAVYNYCLSTN